ncbi:uncharacterized protein CIMG_00107 [Coccidioides immitis RS]|uniref:Uncharacterized protein n=1 Tax=Coccidioides immitis (strain RS) TaxID=246410 RepID=J3KGA7_COCIM|nr:uncharacterized protein CIMG_00107 [Coccidioides immitis RS]EAS34753.3 hypothetical protein CIMG_00107 [Coccidioides immitis RS]
MAKFGIEGLPCLFAQRATSEIPCYSPLPFCGAHIFSPVKSVHYTLLMAQSPSELFATSWTLHRLSPLYHTAESKRTLLEDAQALSMYANRLRDMLTGDTLHGIRLSLDNNSLLDEALAKAGSLKSCRWETLPTWHYWNEERSLLEDPDQETLTITAEQSAGILVTLEYETIKYKAALLCDPDGYHTPRDDDATHLPLLVTRMPTALRQAFLAFLGINFDARCSVLRLPSGFLCSCLETYLATLHQSVRGRHDDREVIERVMKEVQLTLSFNAPVAPALKSVEVSLPRQSLSELYTRGLDKSEALRTPASRGQKRKLGSNTSGISGTESPTPFISALSDYFRTHLAMNIDINTSITTTTIRTPEKHHIRLTKIASGAFVIGFEGRIKLLANPGRTILLDDSHIDEPDAEDLPEDAEEREKRFIWKANEELLRALVARAAGSQSQAERASMTNDIIT